MTAPSPVFRPLLKLTLGNIRQYPWSVLLGLAMSLLGVGGFWELVVNTGSASASATQLAAGIEWWVGHSAYAVLQGFSRTLVESPVSAILLLATLTTIALLVFGAVWLAATSHGALIDTIRKTTLERKTTLRAAWAVGRRFSWKLVGIHLAIKLSIGTAFLVAGFFFYATAGTQSIVVLGALFCILFLLLAFSLTATLTIMYAASYCILRGFTVRESLRLALALFLKHWLISLECATLFFALSVAIGFATILAMLVLSIPFVFLVMTFSILALATGVWATLALWIAIALLLLAGAAALFTTAQATLWTLLFLELTERGATPKLVRLFHKN